MGQMEVTMSYNHYFYGREAEQFTFYRIPKALFTEEKYQDLSSDAKILYSLMLDRMSLSLRNQWLDEKQRVFVYFSQKEAQEVLGCGHNKANTLFADLAKVGLIQRKRQGLGRPDMIYVMKFLTNDKQEGTQLFPDEEAYCPEKKLQEVPKGEGNNTEKNKTDFNENNLSISEPMDEIDRQCELLRRNIDYDILREQAGADAGMVDEIVNLLEDTLRSRKREIKIGYGIYLREIVASRILKLNSEHILYVIDSLKNSRTNIRNIRSYLLTSLYNAPATMESYYTAKVSHDLYGGSNEQ